MNDDLAVSNCQAWLVYAVMRGEDTPVWVSIKSKGAHAGKIIRYSSLIESIR